MKNNRNKKTERKGRMGFVTNRMSDEVYNHLDSKAQKSQLSKYIIELVEKDLKQQTEGDHEQKLDEKLVNLEQKMDKIEQLLLEAFKKTEDSTNKQKQERSMSIDNEWDMIREQMKESMEFFNNQSLFFLASAARVFESWYSIVPRTDKYR